jgi:hypothetical protein
MENVDVLQTITHTSSNSLPFEYVTTADYVVLWLYRTLVPLFIAIGIPGNLLTCVVFGKDPCDASSTARFYYIIMAIFDNVDLICSQLHEVLYKVMPGVWWSFLDNLWLCRIPRYLGLTAEGISNFVLCVLCLERVYAIRNPLKVKTIVTLKRARLIVFGGIAVYASLFIVTGTSAMSAFMPPFVACIFDSTPGGTTAYWFSTLLMLVIPGVIEIACNVVLLRTIFSTFRQRNILSESRLPAREVSATLVVAALTTIHVLILVPGGIQWLIFSFFLFSNVTSAMITLQILHVSEIFFGLLGLTRCSNFFVYFSRMPRFRMQLKRLACTTST